MTTYRIKKYISDVPEYNEKTNELNIVHKEYYKAFKKGKIFGF